MLTTPKHLEAGERAVKLASKLYDARDFVRRMLSDDEYRKRIVEYQGYIKLGAQKMKLTPIEAAMKIVKQMSMEIGDKPIAQACIFAAYVEMIEPSFIP